jgi:hypothetical protein
MRKVSQTYLVSHRWSLEAALDPVQVAIATWDRPIGPGLDPRVAGQRTETASWPLARTQPSCSGASGPKTGPSSQPPPRRARTAQLGHRRKAGPAVARPGLWPRERTWRPRPPRESRASAPGIDSLAASPPLFFSFLFAFSFYSLFKWSY